MDERDFELLKILNETKNITHAAEVLYVSQSSLSKRISAIEQELGVKLLLRSRQGIRFTPEGEKVLHHTQKSSRELEIMRESFSSNKDYISGTLNIGISITYALYRFSDILLEFKKKYSHVNTSIVTDFSRNIFQQIRNESVDVAIVRGNYPWNENKLLIDSENICYICPSEYKDKPLNEIPYIARKTDDSYEKDLIRWTNENNIDTSSPSIYVDDVNTCIEMVSKGLGWAIVPELCLQNFTGHVRPLTFKNGDSFLRPTYLIYSDNITLLPQANAFIEVVKNYKSI